MELGLGRYSRYQYSIDTDIIQYVSIWPSCCTDTDDGDSCKNQRIFRTQNYLFHTWFLYNLTNILRILSLILVMLNFLIVENNRSLCLRTSICRIHCIDQSKTFTLLLKSTILYFETLSRVYTCVSYRIHILLARSVSNMYWYGWWPYHPSPTWSLVLFYFSRVLVRWTDCSDMNRVRKQF